MTAPHTATDARTAPPGPELLVGTVYHRRLRPVDHAFTYPVFGVRLPLRRLDAARCAVFGVDGPGLMSFHQADHGPRDGSPLLPWIEALLARHGLPHDGEILLQTFPRVLGFVFNPVSFWYCHDRHGTLVAVLAEVNNTFGGRHAYLLHHPDGRALRAGEELAAAKVFHVSPFCDVRGGYRFRFHPGPAQVLVRIDHDDEAGVLLRTAVSGRRIAWSTARLLGAFARMPLLTFGVVARIHWQALRLWRRGVPFLGARPPSSTAPTSAP